MEIDEEYIRDSFAFFNGFWLFSNVYNLYPFIKRSKDEDDDEGKLTDEPKISVLIPAYKEESVIIDNVKRIKKADYSNLELILITEKDDFKTDRISFMYLLIICIFNPRKDIPFGVSVLPKWS